MHDRWFLKHITHSLIVMVFGFDPINFEASNEWPMAIRFSVSIDSRYWPVHFTSITGGAERKAGISGIVLQKDRVLRGRVQGVVALVAAGAPD